MPSTRRQKAKARKSREMNILSEIENMDVMLGNENNNPIERELADAMEHSSVQGDGTLSQTHTWETNMLVLLMKRTSPARTMLDNPLRPFQMSLPSDYLKRWIG